MNENGILNLDEILGRSAMKVRYREVEYSLRDVTSLTPDEYARVMEYSEKFANLDDKTLNGENLQSVLQVVDEFIAIIAPGMPQYQPTLKERFSKKGYRRRFTLSLNECVAILQFWVRQTKNARGAVEPVEKPARMRHLKK